MSEPISFTSSAPRFGLPFLFAGQVQKEFFVNEAHALTDLLLHAAVDGEAGIPPSAPADGECWLVGPGASGEWSGHEGQIAGRIGGVWKFASPRDGTTVFDRSTGQTVLFNSGWCRVPSPAAPAGGAVIDIEARESVTQLIETLRNAGIIASI